MLLVFKKQAIIVLKSDCTQGEKMHTNKIFYSFLICISFGLKSVLTLDKIENRAALWHTTYVKDLDPAEQLELYHALSDLSAFSSYAILSEKNYSDIAQLVAFLPTATVPEEASLLKALSFLIKEAVTQYPIKIDYEARVEAFCEKWEKNPQLNEAFNALFSDLKNFTREEGTEHSSLLNLKRHALIFCVLPLY
jgi:predicted nucleotidyltransferase